MLDPYALQVSDPQTGPGKKKKKDPYALQIPPAAAPAPAGKVSSSNPDEWSDLERQVVGLPPKHKPGISDQIRAGAEGAYEAVRHPLRTISGMVKSAIDDATIAQAANPYSGGSGAGMALIMQRLAEQPGLTEENAGRRYVGALARAGINTTANAALPAAGALGLVPRFAVNAGLGAINDPDQPVRGAVAGLLAGEVIHGAPKALGRVIPGKRAPTVEVKPAVEPVTAEPAKVDPTVVTTDEAALRAPGERNLGLSFTKKLKDNIRTAYRSALTTPYAAAEAEAPHLVESLKMGGAAAKRAQDIATYRLTRLFKGLSKTQEEQFGQRLLLDQYEGEAQRKAAVDPAIAKRFTDLADALRPTIPAGIETQPWFQKKLALYKSSVETPMMEAAMQAGVDPADLRPTKLAYMKLASEKRLGDAEIRQALDVADRAEPGDLERRSPFLRKLLGENPALKRYFANQAQGPRFGPLQQNAGGAPVGYGSPGPKTLTTGSARMAAGTAESYSPNLRRVLAVDTREKLIKAANNQVLQQIAGAGRKLGKGELAAPGKRVLSFDPKTIVLIPEYSDPTVISSAQRYEVSPAVHDAVTTYFDAQRPTPKSPARRMVQQAADVATRAQIAGMPVEATSHANTLVTLVSKVLGEKDVTGKVLAAIPGPGAKAAAFREMLKINFDDPKTIALRDRLADIGAMRVEDPHGGLINSSHRFLFGPEGVDPRARLVLARKFLARTPKATDAALREFVTSQAGDYNAMNSGALPNFLAKGSFISPFARFQAARIPTSIKRTIGISDLPAKTTGRKIGDVAHTLYRGPLGYIAGAELANIALSGHSQQKNDPGNALNVNTGFYAVPGGIKRMTPEEAQSKYGDKASPLYLPAATLDPVTYAGLRATGLRSLIPQLSPEQPNALRGENAMRDMTNVGFGTAGPFMRAAQTMLTGTQPYLQADGTFLRVAPRRFSGNVGERFKTAFGLANPAVHAFTASSGDAARTLAGATARDDQFLGGPAAIAARIAEFTMPRVLAPTMGGRSNEQSADAQLDRRYRDVMTDYTGQVKRAPGPKAQQEIIDEARADAQAAGFDPDVVEQALWKAASADPEADAAKRQQAVERRAAKIRQ